MVNTSVTQNLTQKEYSMKTMRVLRGTARALRRQNMAKFRAAQKARQQRSTGTIKVNAPSLEMLNLYIGKVGE